MRQQTKYFWIPGSNVAFPDIQRRDQIVAFGGGGELDVMSCTFDGLVDTHYIRESGCGFIAFNMIYSWCVECWTQLNVRLVRNNV